MDKPSFFDCSRTLWAEVGRGCPRRRYSWRRLLAAKGRAVLVRVSWPEVTTVCQVRKWGWFVARPVDVPSARLGTRRRHLDFLQVVVQSGKCPKIPWEANAMTYLPKLFTMDEVAGMLRCCRRTVCRYRNEGILRGVKVRGRILFRDDELQIFINLHTDQNVEGVVI